MLGIPALRIKFYTEQGLCPGVEVKTGRGNERRYSENDVVMLSLVKELAEVGISLSQIKLFFTQIETEYEASLIPGKLRFSKPNEVFYLVIYKTIGVPDKYKFAVTRKNANPFTLGGDIVTAMIFNLRLIYDKIDWQI